MRISRRNKLSRIMVEAWHLARQGARCFGGSPALYFAVALHLIWQSRKAPCEAPAVLWHKGLGNQFWFPGLDPQQPANRGQFLLPGIAFK